MARHRGRRRRGGLHPHPTHHRVRAHTRITATGRKTRVRAHHRRHPGLGRRHHRARARVY